MSRLKESLLFRIFLAGVFALSLVPAGPAGAQIVIEGPQSLKDVPTPVPMDVSVAGNPQALTNTVLKSGPTAQAALLQLGKALFWDMQVGSDGVTSCASCHFNAGADNRLKNQINPGLLDTDPPLPQPSTPDPYFPFGDKLFGNNPDSPPFPNEIPGNPAFAPDYTLKRTDFPLHQRASIPLGVDQQESAVTRNTTDVVSSQGIALKVFAGIAPGSDVDLSTATDPEDSVFRVGNTNIRRVEPVNTPTVINAVFNHANFWDGRANFFFNGENPFGPAAFGDNPAGIWVQDGANLVKKKLAGTQGLPVLNNASLASQATGPPLSSFEMSFGRDIDTGAQRTWPLIGRKMLALRPLNKQKVHPQDSVLGGLSRATLTKTGLGGNPGLNYTTYAPMVQAAFKDQFHNSTFSAPGGFSQMEANFSFFFGMALQFYQATLVANDSKFDKFLENKASLNKQEKIGLDLFLNAGACIQCHGGPALTNVAANLIAQEGAVEQMAMGDGQPSFYDVGFYNVAITNLDYAAALAAAAPKWFFRPHYLVKIPKDFFF